MIKVISSSTGVERTKPMKEMENGEVCRVCTTKRYVLKVECRFLILGSFTADSYGEDCNLDVRELRSGESITVNYS